MENHNGDSSTWIKDFRTIFLACCHLAEKYVQNKEDAKDIVMDCTTKILANQNFEFRNVPAFKKYLSTAVLNRCTDLHRQNQGNGKYKRPLPLHLTDDDLADVAEYEVDRAILIQLLKDAVATLPDRTRTILQLAYFEGKSTLEISKTLQIARRTVQNTLTNGKEKLRKRFDNIDIFQANESDE